MMRSKHMLVQGTLVGAYRRAYVKIVKDSGATVTFLAPAGFRFTLQANAIIDWDISGDDDE